MQEREEWNTSLHELDKKERTTKNLPMQVLSEDYGGCYRVMLESMAME